MEKVKHVEGKYCRWTFDRCGEPTDAQELGILGDAIGKTTAAAVLDDKTADTTEVKYHEILTRRGIETRVAHAVPQLGNEAESS